MMTDSGSATGKRYTCVKEQFSEHFLPFNHSTFQSVSVDLVEKVSSAQNRLKVHKITMKRSKSAR